MKQGEVGEIYLRGPHLAEFTYNNDDAKRREIALGDLVTVGDVGYQDADGYLFLCDRKRDMIISGGVNIYPAEIESVLIQMPGVRDCAVFGIPDEEFGEQICAMSSRWPARRSMRRPCEAFSASTWRATRCRRSSSSPPRCRARIRARSSNASCATPIGRRRAAASEARFKAEFMPTTSPCSASSRTS